MYMTHRPHDSERPDYLLSDLPELQCGISSSRRDDEVIEWVERHIDDRGFMTFEERSRLPSLASSASFQNTEKAATLRLTRNGHEASIGSKHVRVNRSR
jgi:hypothetical protein